MAASFVSAMHLPATMPFADFEAQLKAQGTDLALGLKVLSGSLTAAEKTRLAARACRSQADPTRSAEDRCVTRITAARHEG
jgi:hypothetical protein